MACTDIPPALAVRRRRVRLVLSWLVAVALVFAVYFQRATIAEAVGQIGTLSVATLAVLGVLAVVDRMSRAVVIRSLLPQLSLRRAEVISDVGAAVSKAIPAGGPVATLLRWRLARDRAVTGHEFVVMIVASGVAAAFVSWAFPLVATVLDATNSGWDGADVAIVAVCSGVLLGSLLFWAFALGSDTAHRWFVRVAGRPLARVGSMIPALADRDADETMSIIRQGLRVVAARPVGLLGRTAVAHGTGALILWMALRGLGVGGELGVSEFARIFFVTHLFGSLSPTPGGVGVIEAGLTGALVAAGVDAEMALAGVLVYRCITYVAPIVVGSVLYVVMQRSLVAERVSLVSAPWRTRRNQSSEPLTP